MFVCFFVWRGWVVPSQEGTWCPGQVAVSTFRMINFSIHTQCKGFRLLWNKEYLLQISQEICICVHGNPQIISAKYQHLQAPQDTQLHIVVLLTRELLEGTRKHKHMRTPPVPQWSMDQPQWTTPGFWSQIVRKMFKRLLG